jgi:hypothetical protein
MPNGMPNMGKYLGLWFVWSVVVAIVAAYLAAAIFGHGQARAAAKLVFAITLIAHGFGTVTASIWEGRPWGTSARFLVDAALYAVGSAAVFYWLWPKA